MRDFIYKDPSFSEISKKIKKMQKELRSAEKKSADRITKLLADRLKIAISAHKWKILDREEYAQYSSSAKDSCYEICLSRVSVKNHNKTSFSKLASPVRFPNRIGAANVAKASRALGKKPLKAKNFANSNPKEVKDYDDFIHFAERWDISQIKRGECFVNFSYENIKITSYIGIEQVFQTIKDLEIPLDLSHHIQNLEKSERELELKRALIKELSAKMLFTV